MIELVNVDGLPLWIAARHVESTGPRRDGEPGSNITMIGGGEPYVVQNSCSDILDKMGRFITI